MITDCEDRRFAIHYSVFCCCGLESSSRAGASTVRTGAKKSPIISRVCEAPPGQNASVQNFTAFSLHDAAKMSDRRREQRLEVCLDATWDGKSGNYTARVTDLSEGGCYMDTLGEAQPGEILSFKLHLPGGDSLELTGEVAHQTPPLGFGLRFINLPDEQIEKLRSLLSQIQPTEGQVTTP
jgi:hypothetical protein